MNTLAQKLREGAPPLSMRRFDCKYLLSPTDQASPDIAQRRTAGFDYGYRFQ